MSIITILNSGGINGESRACSSGAASISLHFFEALFPMSAKDMVRATVRVVSMRVRRLFRVLMRLR